MLKIKKISLTLGTLISASIPTLISVSCIEEEKLEKLEKQNNKLTYYVTNNSIGFSKLKVGYKYHFKQEALDSFKKINIYRFVASVDGKHGVNNKEDIRSRKLEYLPDDFWDYLPNVKIFKFANNNLTEFKIPKNITFISEYALANNKLTSIVIPDSITSIEEGAFKENELAKLTIPNSVISIGKKAFAHNKLTSLTIPNLLTSIESGAFRQNELTSLKIPNSVIRIADRAFTTNKLKSLVIPKSVKHIGEYAFSFNPLTSIQISNPSIVIEKYSFSLKKDKSKATISLPSAWKKKMKSKIEAFGYDKEDFKEDFKWVKSKLISKDGTKTFTFVN